MTELWFSSKINLNVLATLSSFFTGTKIPFTGSHLYRICASTFISVKGASIETQLSFFTMASLLKRLFLFAT